VDRRARGVHSLVKAVKVVCKDFHGPHIEEVGLVEREGGVVVCV
jgi:hypothetical protein